MKKKSETVLRNTKHYHEGRSSMNRGIHSKPNNGHTNEWMTPPEVLSGLGHFDLDPCAHPEQPWRTAKEMISPPQDGLALDWVGRVWLNPPYGASLKTWLARLADHGNGIALVPGRTEVESWFWPYIWERADSILFFRGRLYFRKPSGEKCGNAGHGSVLAAYGRENTKTLQECGLRGKVIVLK